MNEWIPIETAPKEAGVEFLALQDGDIYQARRDEYGRLSWRTHARWEPRTYRLMPVEVDGEMAERKVLIEEPPATWEHHWTCWCNLFDFRPTHWAPKPTLPA